MLGDVIAVVEMLRGLINQKNELDKNYFDNFIQPIWTVVEKTHTSYKASFQGYTDFISQDGAKKDALLEIIRRDYLYNLDVRYQILGLIENIPPIKFKAKEQYLHYFLVAILEYFGIRSMRFPISNTDTIEKYIEIEFSSEFPAEYIRHLRKDSAMYSQYRAKAHARIRDCFALNMTSEIIELLDITIKEAQVRYEKVARSYYALKKDLLS